MQNQWYRFWGVKWLYTFGVALIDGWNGAVLESNFDAAAISALSPNDAGTGAEHTCEHEGGKGNKNILGQNNIEIVVRLVDRSTRTAEEEVEIYDRSDSKYVARFEVNFTLPPSQYTESLYKSATNTFDPFC